LEPFDKLRSDTLHRTCQLCQL